MSDRKSKVPYRVYPEDLAGQMEALKNDPVLERFEKSREELSGNPIRAVYHFTTPESHLNDPNGLSFWQGKWHLFYQAFPPEDPRLHWGHAVSTDLAHWKDLPYAIYPDPESNCFSGSALVEENRVLAMYHGTECGNMVAESSDPLLLNWSKITGDAVIKRPENAPYYLYDPCIWKQGDYYYSLSGEFLPHPVSGRRSRTEHLFRSADLKHWEYLHPFYDSLEFSELDDDGACPYFWPLGDRWILLHFSHCFGPKWILGDYDTENQKFLPIAGGKFNNIGGNFPGGVGAPSACPLPDGSVACIFCMGAVKDNGELEQVMSLPWRISLTGFNRDEICIEPLGDFDSLHGESTEVGETVLPANEEVVLPVHGKAMELRLTLETGTAPLELNVFRSPDAKEVTRIRFYPTCGGMNWKELENINSAGGWGWFTAHYSVLSVESSESTLDPEVRIRAPQTCKWYHPANTPLELRVFLDNSVLEVFADNQAVVSLRVFPSREDSDGVSLVSHGKDGKLLKLQAWQMKSAFQENEL